MAVSKQIKPREGILANWRRVFRSTKIRPPAKQAQVRAEALRDRRAGPGGRPDQPPDGSNPPVKPSLMFGVGLLAVVTVLSLVAYEYDIPQIFPMLGAGVGAIAGFLLFEEIRRLF